MHSNPLGMPGNVDTPSCYRARHCRPAPAPRLRDSMRVTMLEGSKRAHGGIEHGECKAASKLSQLGWRGNPWHGRAAGSPRTQGSKSAHRRGTPALLPDRPAHLHVKQWRFYVASHNAQALMIEIMMMITRTGHDRPHQRTSADARRILPLLQLQIQGATALHCVPSLRACGKSVCSAASI